MRIGILVPHVFAQQEILDRVIFAPVHLAIMLANGLSQTDEVYLFTPGAVKTEAINITVDLKYLRREEVKEGCTISEMANINPMAFVSLSKQIQAEITAKAFKYANTGEIDILHVYVCEDEIPLYFSDLIKVPVVYTHHDPYNFYRKYRATFPKLKNLNYVSISYAQQKTAPGDMNFVANIYNGIDIEKYKYVSKPEDYFAFLGRIIQVKGCDKAIKSCLRAKQKLYIGGKHYSSGDDVEGTYWTRYIEPYIDNKGVIYKGFIKPGSEVAKFLGNAKALLFPSVWSEPFGMVMIEALACGTPVIAFNNGAVPEIIEEGVNGYIVQNVREMEKAINRVEEISRAKCRESVMEKFTCNKMIQKYRETYSALLEKKL